MLADSSKGRGAVTPKARSPAVESCDLHMTSLLNEAERSRVLDCHLRPTANRQPNTEVLSCYGT